MTIIGTPVTRVFWRDLSICSPCWSSGTIVDMDTGAILSECRVPATKEARYIEHDGDGRAFAHHGLCERHALEWWEMARRGSITELTLDDTPTVTPET